MDVEILIHGVPDGQDYFGIKNEQTNMELFYDSSVESVKFVVETKKQGDQAYAYYSYLRYRNMIGAGGRPGSYFGLTLRMDMYYQDVILIYDLLEIVFKKHIVGTLLSPTSDGYKYIVPSLGHKKADIEKMQNALLQLIQTSCVASKFLNIDSSLINSISAAPSANITDVSEGAILATLKKYSKIVLSPDYETNVVKDIKNKMKEAEGKGGNLVAAKDKVIAEKDSTINSLNTTIATQQSKIASLEQESKRKDTEIQQLKKTGDLRQLLDAIRDPLTKLARSDYFREKNPQLDSDYGYKNHRIGMINGILTSTILVVIIVLFFIFKPSTGGGSANPTKSKEYVSLKTQYDELSKTYNNLLIQIQKQNGDSQAAAKKAEEERKAAEAKKAEEERKAAAKKAEADRRVAEAKKAEEERKAAAKKAEADRKVAEAKKAEEERKAAAKKAEEERKAAANNVVITVNPKVDEVEVGKEYTFSVAGYDGNGVWAVDGFSAPSDKTASSIKVTAIEKGNEKATISYTPEGGQKKIKSYNYKKAND